MCAHETVWWLNGITLWLWCSTPKSLCYYLIRKSRGSPVAQRVLGSQFGVILICDFWNAYNKIIVPSKKRCFFHLFSELPEMDETNRSPSWKAFRKSLPRLLKEAVRLSQRKYQFKDGNAIAGKEDCINALSISFW
ncbi:MAG: transposase [Deltaproteobacteria bacterium]|nr:transposase [Deltaproteobacteria bacterium]